MWLHLLTVLALDGVHGNNLFERSQPFDMNGVARPAASLAQCALLCVADDSCTQAEFQEAHKSCVMTNSTFQGPEVLGLPEPGKPVLANETAPGNGMHLTVSGSMYKPLHCGDVQSHEPTAPSGLYNIWPDNNTESRVWCDMDTEGGRWTMVYSYRTRFMELNMANNSVTPIPTWPITSPDLVEASTTPPNDIHQYGALNFSLWQHIGEEFMIQSTINNWIACVAGSGSLTKWMVGSLECRMVKSITIQCPDVPSGCDWNMMIAKYGPTVRLCAKHVYYFDGDSVSHWPAHDPCGKTSTNHLKNIYPEGMIWVR